METNDMLKMVVLMQLMNVVPSFLKEKMMHDLLRTLDYKLSESELKELHEYLNPPPLSFGVPMPPIAQRAISVKAFSPQDRQDLIESISCEIDKHKNEPFHEAYLERLEKLRERLAEVGEDG